MAKNIEDKHINAGFVDISLLVNLGAKMLKQAIYEIVTLYESKHINN
jgi:hypothetical protein